ncbi:MAG: hypothetical protein ACFCAD_12915 [Pleurocapsa sp.]
MSDPLASIPNPTTDAEIQKGIPTTPHQQPSPEPPKIESPDASSSTFPDDSDPFK